MLLILVGKSGVGKTQIMYELTKHGFSIPPSYTTRPPRPNDDKIHLTDEEFDRLKQEHEFVDYVKYGGYKYGRKKSDILKAKETNLVIDLEPSGLSKYIDFCSKYQIPYYIVYLKCPEEWRIQRIQNDNIRRQRDDKYFDYYLDTYDLIIDVYRISTDKIISIIKTLVGDRHEQ